MNNDNILKEKWQEIKSAIRTRFGDQVSQADLDGTNPRRVELCHLLARNCSLTEKEANEYVDDVLLDIQNNQVSA